MILNNYYDDEDDGFEGWSEEEKAEYRKHCLEEEKEREEERKLERAWNCTCGAYSRKTGIQIADCICGAE